MTVRTETHDPTDRNRKSCFFKIEELVVAVTCIFSPLYNSKFCQNISQMKEVCAYFILKKVCGGFDILHVNNIIQFKLLSKQYSSNFANQRVLTLHKHKIKLINDAFKLCT